MSATLIKTYDDVFFNVKEALHYYKGGSSEEVVSEFQKVKDVFTYSVIYTELSVTYKDGIIDFGEFCVKSDALTKNFNGAKKAVLFIATVGNGIDRLIKKNLLISPSKSLLYQAIGAERVESLCDKFCSEIKEKYGKTCPRFSPGYSDLELETQKDVFKVLSPSKIGVSLSEGLLMSPSKTVSAFIGLGESFNMNKCLSCDKENCEYKETK